MHSIEVIIFFSSENRSIKFRHEFNLKLTSLKFPGVEMRVFLVGNSTTFVTLRFFFVVLSPIGQFDQTSRFLRGIALSVFASSITKYAMHFWWTFF